VYYRDRTLGALKGGGVLAVTTHPKFDRVAWHHKCPMAPSAVPYRIFREVNVKSATTRNLLVKSRSDVDRLAARRFSGRATRQRL